MQFRRKKPAPKHCTMTHVSINGDTYYTIKQDNETEEQFLERATDEAHAYFDTL